MAQEERFSRRKNDPRFPMSALHTASRRVGSRSPTLIALPITKTRSRSWRQVWTLLPRIRGHGVNALLRLDPARPLAGIRRGTGYSGQIICFEHHLSHAASTYYFSGFADAAILTVDGVGEWATATYGRGDGHRAALLQEVRFPTSLALLYSTVTAYLGFEVNDGEYKVMGLAPYGESRVHRSAATLGYITVNGDLDSILHSSTSPARGPMYTDRLARCFGRPPEHRSPKLPGFTATSRAACSSSWKRCLLAMCRSPARATTSRTCAWPAAWR